VTGSPAAEGPGPDPWELYSSTRDRFIDLVRPLGPTGAATTVPLTPGWTIAQVLAHVCGLNADVAAGMREGLGTDDRTAHQVASRADRPVAEICDEWLGHAPAMREAIADDGFFGLRLSADLVVHLHDVRHALGLPIDPVDVATVSGGRTYASRTPDRLAEATGIGLAIELDGPMGLVDHDERSRFAPSPGGPDPSVTLRASAFDVLRSITGRRSRREVVALDWSGDPGPLLDHLCPYGPLRSTDAGI
jgi:uncharacterized protein (TIGR03083 family)